MRPLDMQTNNSLRVDGPTSLSQMMMDQAAAMGSAPNFNKGLLRMNAIMQRDQRTNAQAAYQQ